MSRYWNGNYEMYNQISTRDLKKNIKNTEKKSAGKGIVREPVITGGRKIAVSWWGEAWCRNLERYADFESRLDRGKRYVRSGAVVDLKITQGRISALVQGTRKIPYKVEIRISPLSEEKCEKLINRSDAKIESMENLIGGTFPSEMKELFLDEDGLFPTPREISFSCSCPDWALMCKHVAAALYGVAVRLDEDPLLFFKMRGIDVNRFVDVAIENKIESMLSHADCRSARIIDSRMQLKLFGV